MLTFYTLGSRETDGKNKYNYMLDNLQLLINAGNVTKTDPKISTLELGLLVY